MPQEIDNRTLVAIAQGGVETAISVAEALAKRKLFDLDDYERLRGAFHTIDIIGISAGAAEWKREQAARIDHIRQSLLPGE